MADAAIAQYLAPEGDAGQIDDITTEDMEDGGLLVTMGPLEAEKQEPEEGDFFRNLADDVIPEIVLDRIVSELMQRIEQDKEARAKHDEKYAEGIKRTGLGNEAPGGADFPGASRVVHPAMTEACIDYESRIMKELWPTGGPVKKKILGKPTQEKDERASRKVDYMNYQLVTLIKEARSTMESTLTQTPLGGVQYIRQWFDARRKRPRWQFIGVDRVYLPSNATDYYSSHRRTYAETISGVELKLRTDQGIYRECSLVSSANEPEPSKAGAANDKIEGLDSTSTTNLDENREIYETMAYLEVTDEMAAVLEHEQDGDLCPYLITMDVTSKKVLAFYRDWEPDDEAKEPIDHLFEFPFLPWEGPYGIGLPHVIGGLSGAATGALRALLDSAHIANTQGYFVLKGSGTGGQNKNPKPGEAVEIDSGMEADDIRKKIMPFSTKEPSGVLFQLLGFVVEAMKGTVRTSLDENPDVNPNSPVPVGTQMSRVEEGLVVFSSIHGRIHAAFDRLLSGLHRLNRMYLPDFVRVDDKGKEIVAYRTDFDGPVDVQPVSDPTIYSDQQRFAQIAGMEQAAAVFPNLYDVREIQAEKLRLLKVAEPERFLIAPPKPTELNAVNENVAMALGKPTVAFPEQDHLAHLQAHLDFLQSPALGSNPLIVQRFLPAALNHCIEHILFQYAKTTVDVVSKASGQPAHKLFSDDANVKAALDQLLALASQTVVPQMGRTFAKALPVLQQAHQALMQMQQQAQQQQNQLPADPAAMAAAQIAGQEVQRKTALDKQTGALTQMKTTGDQSLKAQQIEASRENAALAAATKLKTTELDVASAQRIAQDRLESGQSPRFSDGASLSD